MSAAERLNTALAAANAGYLKHDRKVAIKVLKPVNPQTRVLRSEPFEELRIGEILCAAGLAFVPDEVSARNHPDLCVVETRRHSPTPRTGEVNAVQPGQQVHPVRSSIGRGSRPWLLEYRAGCVTPC